MADLWQYYLLIIVVSIQGLFCLKNKNKSFLFITFFELFFISGFRNWNIGNDTLEYVHAFMHINSSFDLIKSHMEKGYLLFNKILSLFTNNPQAILIVTSFCILSVIFYSLYKYSKFIFLSILLFVILQFSVTLNIVRQEMSLIIVLLGFVFVVERKFLYFLIFCLLAATFHKAAILAITFYFIYPLNIKMKNIFIILILTIFIFIFIAPIIDEIISITGRYKGYIGNRLIGEDLKTASIVKAIIEFSIFLFCFISYFFVCSKQVKKTAFIIRPQFLLLSSLLALCVQFVSIRGTVLERAAIYFSFFNMISIPAFINCYSKNMKFILTIIIIGFFILYRCIIFTYRPEWNHVLPFEFCFYK